MLNLKKIVAVAMLMVSASAYAGWESATNTGESETGDWRYTRCHYETLGGFRFSTVIEGRLCPYRVEINPETGQVKK
ncbi:MAG: hypothetical protein Q4E16_03210 [Neisseria sp.]|nr:hypothetical protein [Neisseria sp.]